MIEMMFVMALALTPAQTEANYRTCLRFWAPEPEIADAPPIVLFGRAVEACAYERSQFVDSLDSSGPEDSEYVRNVRRAQAEWELGDLEAQLFRRSVRMHFELGIHDQRLAPLER
jgi:hypothetical protein